MTADRAKRATNGRAAGDPHAERHGKRHGRRRPVLVRDRRGGWRDRGSATIWTAGAIAVLFLLASAILAVGAATATRHRVASAADLAALAAADHAPDGEQVACGWARWVTDQMRVRLTSCALDGWDALVRTAADPPGPLAPFGAATARARAGPAEG